MKGGPVSCWVHEFYGCSQLQRCSLRSLLQLHSALQGEVGEALYRHLQLATAVVCRSCFGGACGHLCVRQACNAVRI